MQYLRNKWSDYRVFIADDHAFFNHIFFIVRYTIIQLISSFAFAVMLIISFSLLMSLPLSIPAPLFGLIFFALMSVTLISFGLLAYTDLLNPPVEVLLFLPYVLLSSLASRVKMLFKSIFKIENELERLERKANTDQSHPSNKATIKLKARFEDGHGDLKVGDEHPCQNLLDPLTNQFINHPVVIVNDPYRFWEQSGLNLIIYHKTNGQILNPVTRAPFASSDILDAKQLYSNLSAKVLRGEVVDFHAEIAQEITKQGRIIMPTQAPVHFPAFSHIPHSASSLPVLDSLDWIQPVENIEITPTFWNSP